MCGIAGYVGPQSAVPIVFDQLRRLEYRGYDSAGIAFPQGDRIGILKRAGKLSGLGEMLAQETPESQVAIAHSRWATHGPAAHGGGDGGGRGDDPGRECVVLPRDRRAAAQPELGEHDQLGAVGDE